MSERSGNPGSGEADPLTRSDTLSLAAPEATAALRRGVFGYATLVRYGTATCTAVRSYFRTGTVDQQSPLGSFGGRPRAWLHIRHRLQCHRTHRDNERVTRKQPFMA